MDQNEILIDEKLLYLIHKDSLSNNDENWYFCKIIMISESKLYSRVGKNIMD